MEPYEKGLLTDRAVRRVEQEQREASVEERRYSKTLKRVGRSFKNVRSLSPFSPCSLPVVLSCVLVGTILIMDMNQYILGNLHCKMTIFSFQFLYPPNSGAQILSDSMFEPFLHFSNHSTEELQKRIYNADDGGYDDKQDVATTRDLALKGVSAFRTGNSAPIQPNDTLDRDSSSHLDGATVTDVKPIASNHTFSEEDSNMDNVDRSIFSFDDDSRVDKSRSMDKRLIQAGTQLITQAGADPHLEAGSQLQVESGSTQRESGGGSVTSSDLADVEVTDGGNLFLEESPPVPPADCDIFYGHWVYDETYPLYAPSSCPFVDVGFSCTNNGRLDTEYLKWRWQPYDCDLPRFNGTDLLERLRNKRMTFVGDSLGRNQWESMLCMLYHAAANKSRIFEVNGARISKHQSYLAIQYSDYNATVEFHRAPFLVHQGHRSADAPSYANSTLHVDRIDSSAKKWNRSHMLIFNTGHWWTDAKTLRGHCYFAKNGKVVNMEVLEAFGEGMRTWAQFVDRNIDSKVTRVFFRSFSPTHFRGGQWNTGGQCNVETTPYTNRTRYDVYHPPTEKVRIAEGVISMMKTPVTLLNATELTDYRRDGHPSKWTQTAGTYGGGVNGSRYQDCSHWCLPGVPDTWNELLYASLIMHPGPHYDLSSRSNGSTRQHKKRTVKHVIQKAHSKQR